MKKLFSILLMLPLLAPQSSFAAKADAGIEPFGFTYQKITWTFRSESAEDLSAQFCKKMTDMASSDLFYKKVVQYNETDFNFVVRLKSTGNETAMEELSLAHEGLTYEGCQKQLESELIAAQVAFAPLKPAELTEQSEPTKLDGTSMATPAVKGEVSKKTNISMPTLQARHRAELDHVGAYNFRVEIGGIDAGQFAGTDE